MAAIIAQMTRANRERKKKKRIEISKCMYELPPFTTKFEPQVTKSFIDDAQKLSCRFFIAVAQQVPSGEESHHGEIQRGQVLRRRPPAIGGDRGRGGGQSHVQLEASLLHTEKRTIKRGETNSHNNDL